MFFTLVVAMVAYVTISRFITAERPRLACYKVLGHPGSRIAGAFAGFVALVAVAGCVIGLVGGHYAIAPTLYSIISFEWGLVGGQAPFPALGAITALILVGFLAGLTFVLTAQSAGRAPTELLTPVIPDGTAGARLERLALFGRLRFRDKSMLRNIVRYQMRFAMTVVSVLGGTALVAVGLGLRSGLVAAIEGGIAPIERIAAVLILSAIALIALVVYNITNINIDERWREIATLRVLGYTYAEVCGYVFRELAVLTILGVVLGLPVGYAFLQVLFGLLHFGTVAVAAWWTWPAAAALALISLGLADLALVRKIKRVDANGALKTID